MGWVGVGWVGLAEEVGENRKDRREKVEIERRERGRTLKRQERKGERRQEERDWCSISSWRKTQFLV